MCQPVTVKVKINVNVKVNDTSLLLDNPFQFDCFAENNDIVVEELYGLQRITHLLYCASRGAEYLGAAAANGSATTVVDKKPEADLNTIAAF